MRRMSESDTELAGPWLELDGDPLLCTRVTLPETNKVYSHSIYIYSHSIYIYVSKNVPEASK